MKWWVDRGLINGREYFYRVRAVRANGQLSAASEEDSDFVDPLATPWDTRDARKILAHTSRAAEQADPDHQKIRPGNLMAILGPDGMIYERGSDGKYYQQRAKESKGDAFPLG